MLCRISGSTVGRALVNLGCARTALRVECFQLLERKPNVDGERARPQCRQRAIEIAAAIAEPIGGAIEAD